MVDADTLEYRYTVEDPAVYVRPYTAVYELSRDDDYVMSPWVCHEKNRDMGAILANARADEAGALKGAADAAAGRRRRLEDLKAELAEWNKNH
jgi:hypothetical protein